MNKYSANFLNLAFPLLAILLIGISCKDVPKIDISNADLIPVPKEIIPAFGSFEVSQSFRILVNDERDEVLRSAEIFADFLRKSSGFDVPVYQNAGQLNKESLVLSVGDFPELGEEGYELFVDDDHIRLNANNPVGLFWGLQTLRQLFPVQIEKNEVQSERWLIGTGVIRDYPRYEHRGAMLDVSRHFFGVEDVKRFIDFMAAYKMNRFHMHLSDDQGWRIEIKSWPKLTEIGGSTQVGGGEGGYYTQEDFSEIVKYADERYIIVIPEIDMPGHTNAALASYAELNEDGVARELYTGMEVGFSTLAARKEITYQFVDDVVREISELINGPFFHIGGDESHVTPKDDYVYFINRAQDIINSYGLKMIGWDEIATADLLPTSIVQLWASPENARLAIEQNARIIMSPAKHAYLDMKYDSTTVLGLNWAGYTEVDEAYNWDPTTFIDGVPEEFIIGVESPLWTETIETMADIEYMVFPRLPGIAEIAWADMDQRNWDEYKFRLARHGYRLEAKGINFYRSPKVPWNHIE
ncbi:beta-N-acetylhexosaminidase [Natronoflexus pectinivorans]|uniref:beta-N-acetylhexosaminidase n=1 Tax=Natronoflexus pectinivorans TaxID=682526 RepID=A0A4R2GMD0_9BACT|nr:beta-N-acetylhexosaminidase [Natronoflexus pectinivorans]TCO08753.1 hexosaminidase [Natronoflexus pectinivorans]